MPKQYLPLLGQPIAMYSLQTLCSMPEVGEVVVVCDPSYQVKHPTNCLSAVPSCSIVALGNLVHLLHRRHAQTECLSRWTFKLLRQRTPEDAVAVMCKERSRMFCSAQEVFQEYYRLLPEKPPLKFAQPGAERQDSVYNGFQVC